MGKRLLLLSMLLCAMAPAMAPAEVSIGIGFPNVSIGINLPFYPDLEPVPGYPVYYAPRLDSNYFFYDGMYWVYQEDDWYASSWYNGPWARVDREAVPLFVLRVPVRYYRRPPAYFRAWQMDAPPRWGDHWGRGWAQHHSGWDRWDRRSAPVAAPLPFYQRQYSGTRYPSGPPQQQRLHNQNYRYQPQDPVVRQRYQGQRGQAAPASPQRETPRSRQERNAGPQDGQRGNPYLPQQRAPGAPHAQSPQYRGKDMPRPPPAQAQPQRSGPPVQPQSEPRQQGAAPQPERDAHGRGSDANGKGAKQKSEQKHGQGKDREQDDDHGQDHPR